MERRFLSSEYTLTNICAYRFRPIGRKGLNANRPRSAFLLPLAGTMYYEYGGERLDIAPQELLYLPKSSAYSYRFPDDDTEIMQVEFDLCITENGVRRDVLLAEKPSKRKVNEQEVRSLLETIIRGYDSERFATRSKACAALLELSALFSREAENADAHRVACAIAYIEEHRLERVYVEQLAELCGLSQAQLRRLFKKATGLTPVEYKNQLVLRYACDLLRTETFSISEVAYTLRFDDVFGFSKFFKKGMGVSPSEYRKRMNG